LIYEVHFCNADGERHDCAALALAKPPQYVLRTARLLIGSFRNSRR